MSDVKEFFRAYGEAATGEDVIKIADFFSHSFLVVAPNESRSFSNDGNFLKWLQSVYKFNRKTGLRQMVVRKVDEQSFSRHAIQAEVTWGALYEKTGDQVIEFTIHYILQEQGSKLKIILYASDQDQEEIMKEKGLL